MTPASVAVVGAGLAGAACARALSDAGVRVDVLDRGAARAGGCPPPRGRAPGRPGRVLLHRPRRALLRRRRAVAGARTGPPLDRRLPPGRDRTGWASASPGPLRWGAAGGPALAGSRPARRPGRAPGRRGGRDRARPARRRPVLRRGGAGHARPAGEPAAGPGARGERAAVADRAWEPVLAVAAGLGTSAAGSPAFDGCFVEGSDVLGLDRRRRPSPGRRCARARRPLDLRLRGCPADRPGRGHGRAGRRECGVLGVDEAPPGRACSAGRTPAGRAAGRDVPPRRVAGRAVRRRWGFAAGRDRVGRRATRSGARWPSSC
jgi:hypothetical protein